MRTNQQPKAAGGLALALAGIGAVAIVDAIVRRAKRPSPAPVKITIVAVGGGKLGVDLPDVTMTAPGWIFFKISKTLPHIYFKDKGTIEFDTGRTNFCPPVKEIGSDDKAIRVWNKYIEMGSFKYTLYLDGPGDPEIDPRVHNGPGFGPAPFDRSEPILDRIFDLLFGE